MIREFAAIDVYYLLLAARWTIALTALAFVGGGLFGIVVALMRVSPFLPLRAFGAAYVNLVQGIPLLGWLFVFFFGLPILAGVQVSPWIAATVAFSFYAGAFLGEIWRGCLQAIPRQQWEAGAALGPLALSVYAGAVSGTAAVAVKLVDPGTGTAPAGTSLARIGREATSAGRAASRRSAARR